ncbi:6817_t:CDS:2, partial [Cetraspora pellucida]
MSQCRVERDEQKAFEYETNTYPQNPVIHYKTSHRSLVYTIVSEGIYPKKNKHTTITCSIDYIETKPYYFIRFGDGLNDFVKSDKSPLCAANNDSEELQIKVIVKVIDVKKISHSAYRTLAAI